jgi:hypothetical protein
VLTKVLVLVGNHSRGLLPFQAVHYCECEQCPNKSFARRHTCAAVLFSFGASLKFLFVLEDSINSELPYLSKFIVIAPYHSPQICTCPIRSPHQSHHSPPQIFCISPLVCRHPGNLHTANLISTLISQSPIDDSSQEHESVRGSDQVTHFVNYIIL